MILCNFTELLVKKGGMKLDLFFCEVLLLDKCNVCPSDLLYSLSLSLSLSVVSQCMLGVNGAWWG